MMTFDGIPSHMEGVFLWKLEKANKKLAKLRQKIEIISEKRTSHTIEGITKRCINYEISEPEITGRPNCEYIGTVNIEAGIKTVFNKNEKYVLSEEKERCDHCNSKRMRKKYFYFLENDQLKCIGSTCAQEYFGFNIERILSIFEELAKEIDEDSLIGYRGFYYRTFDDLVFATAFMCQDGHWKKNEIGNVLTDIENPKLPKMKIYEDFIKKNIPDLKKFVADVKEKLVAKYLNVERKTDFDHNIFNTLFGNDNIREAYPKAFGIVGYAVYTVLYPKTEKKIEKISNYVGKIKQKYETTVSVIKTIFIGNGMYDKLLIIFEDENGNQLIWFRSNTDDEFDRYEKPIKIKATIKDHDEYNGKKITYITRTKVLN